MLVGRATVLWLLWLTLVNLSIMLYFQAFRSVFGLLFNAERLLWVLFAFNTVAIEVVARAAATGGLPCVSGSRLPPASRCSQRPTTPSTARSCC